MRALHASFQPDHGSPDSIWCSTADCILNLHQALREDAALFADGCSLPTATHFDLVLAGLSAGTSTGTQQLAFMQPTNWHVVLARSPSILQLAAEAEYLAVHFCMEAIALVQRAVTAIGRQLQDFLNASGQMTLSTNTSAVQSSDSASSIVDDLHCGLFRLSAQPTQAPGRQGISGMCHERGC